MSTRKQKKASATPMKTIVHGSRADHDALHDHLHEGRLRSGNFYVPDSVRLIQQHQCACRADRCQRKGDKHARSEPFWECRL